MVLVNLRKLKIKIIALKVYLLVDSPFHSHVPMCVCNNFRTEMARAIRSCANICVPIDLFNTKSGSEPSVSVSIPI